MLQLIVPQHPRYALAAHMERLGDGTWVVNFPAPEEDGVPVTRGEFWPPVYGSAVREFRYGDGC